MQEKRTLVQRLRQEISMLPGSRHVHNFELPPLYTLTDKVVADVNVLRVGGDCRVDRQVDSALIVLVHSCAPDLPVRKSRTPDIPHENHLFQSMRQRRVTNKCLLPM